MYLWQYVCVTFHSEILKNPITHFVQTAAANGQWNTNECQSQKQFIGKQNDLMEKSAEHSASASRATNVNKIFFLYTRLVSIYHALITMRHNMIVHSGAAAFSIDMRQTVFDWTSNKRAGWQRSRRGQRS